MIEDVSDIVGYHSDEEPNKTSKPKKKHAGRLVTTKTGAKGITKSSDPVMDGGKVCVYLEDGSKMICKTKNLKVTGYYD